MKSSKNGGASRINHRQGRLCHYFQAFSGGDRTLIPLWLEAWARISENIPRLNLAAKRLPLIVGQASLPLIVGQASLPVIDARSATKQMPDFFQTFFRAFL